MRPTLRVSGGGQQAPLLSEAPETEEGQKRNSGDRYLGINVPEGTAGVHGVGGGA